LADAFDRWRQASGVDGVSWLDVVVEDDAVLVVDQLCFVAELDWLAQPLAALRRSTAAAPAHGR
jgi:hypothetical protein